MRKSRVRAIRKRVETMTGKPVDGMVVLGTSPEGNVTYIPSLRRRLKKAYLSMRRGA